MNRITSIYCLAILVAITNFVSSASIANAQQAMTYSELRNLVKSGKAKQITKLTTVNGNSIVYIEMAGSASTISVVVPTELKQKLLEECDDAGVALEAREADKSGTWLSVLSSFFLPLLLLVGFLFMFRRAQRRS